MAWSKSYSIWLEHPYQAGSACLRSCSHSLAQGLLNKLCRTKPAIKEGAATGSDPGQLLKPVLFTAAREADKRAARAGCDAFLWLLKAAVAHNSPQVHGL